MLATVAALTRCLRRGCVILLVASESEIAWGVEGDKGRTAWRMRNASNVVAI